MAKTWRDIRGRPLDSAITGAALAFGGIILANTLAAERPDPVTPRSIAEAQNAVSANPLDVVALRNLAIAFQSHGQASTADALFGFIGERTWRDEPTETWLIEHRLQEGRFQEAFEQADALLRRNIAEPLRERLMRVLIAAAATEPARPALVDRLAEAPWWRPGFLRQLGAAGDLVGARTVLLGLRNGEAPPRPHEYEPYINRRIAAGEYRGAMEDWNALQRHPSRSGLIDPDFIESPDGTPFRWTGVEGVGASGANVRIGQSLAMVIDYDGFSSPTLPGRLLVLPVGRYRLTWRERLEIGPAERLTWQIRCADATPVQASSTIVADQGNWRLIRMEFQVPLQACPAQWLTLAAQPGERRNPVVVAYSGFRLKRDDAPRQASAHPAA